MNIIRIKFQGTKTIRRVTARSMPIDCSIGCVFEIRIRLKWYSVVVTSIVPTLVGPVYEVRNVVYANSNEQQAHEDACIRP